MKNYVVSGFTHKYWNYEGASWLASLLNIAKYTPKQIIIFAFDLPLFVRNQISDYGIKIIECNYEKNFRISTVKHICDYASNTNDNFAYWNIDAYFQEDISEVFQSQICVTNNLGFISAPAKEWKFIKQIANAADVINIDVASCLCKYYCGKTKILSDTFNFTDVGILNEVNEKLCFQNMPQKVIHVLPQMKTKIFDKQIAFADRHKELLHQFLNRSVSKKLLLHNL